MNDSPKSARYYLVVEPFAWLFFCFFQPARFSQEIEQPEVLRRIALMLRLVLPVFVVAYLLSLLLLFLEWPFTRWGFSYSLNAVAPLSGPSPLSGGRACCAAGQQLLFSAGATLLGILPAFAWGVIGGRAGGLARGIALGIACGCTAGSSALSHDLDGILAAMRWDYPNQDATVIAAATLGGVVGSIGGRFVEVRRTGAIWASARGVIGGLAGAIAGCLAGIITLNLPFSFQSATPGDVPLGDLPLAILGGIGGGIVGALVESLGEARRARFIGRITKRFPERLAWVIVGGLAGGMAGAIGRGIQVALSSGLVDGFLLTLVVGLTLGLARGLSAGCAWGLLGGLLWSLALALGVTLTLAQPLLPDSGQFLTLESALRLLAILGLAFFVGYLPGIYRLPFYPLSATSTLRAALASRRNPPGVFQYLKRSALHWDELVFLPLPGLKRTLVLATEQDLERAQQEIAFIARERPHQLAAARAAALEILLRDLEQRERLQEIARAFEQIAELLPPDVRLIDPHWVTPFARLSDASRDATLACSPVGKQARAQALQEMLGHLSRLHGYSALNDTHLSQRLSKVARLWQQAALQAQEELKQGHEGVSWIENPYKPGPVLELRDTLFVGRRDLIQQLAAALEKGAGRPTFLLTGERRMGKTSALQQLPYLLGARYIPVIFDLQLRGLTASTPAFLGAIAEEVVQTLTARGLPAERLEYTLLREASRENEAEVYRMFTLWLEQVEALLEREDRTLLLIFDEFEKLEEAGKQNYLDLHLLLDWFRHIIQHHHRLALLFSGIGTLGEFGASWVSYLVNVQILRVSFLRPIEARELILHPTPDFPGEQVFAEDVIEEIMRATACHPFLVQAVCSALIDHLNARPQVGLTDAYQAANQVIENWGDTYFRDLWERSSQEEQRCLIALNLLGKADATTLARQHGLDDGSVHRALRRLLRRDLVTQKQGIYRITVPLFSQWVLEQK
jgi:hypothetical protein